MSLVDYCFHLGVTSWTSDRSVDFHRGAGAPDRPFSLTPGQTDFLQRSGGVPVAERLTFPRQVHGGDVWRVTAREAGGRGEREADAIVTDVPGMPVAVRTADCVPCLLYDPVRRVAAAVHAGWKSTRVRIVTSVLDLMEREFGCDPREIRAAVGPCIRRESFEVGPEFKRLFPLDIVPREGGLCMDLAGANVRHMLEAGLMKENIFDCGLCTFRGNDCFFSYRREGAAAGRLLSVIML